jgi:hypothetical protein
MGISQIMTGISVFVVGLVPASCHHKSAPAKPIAPVAAVATNSMASDLGEISLTNHYERCVQLGNGKQCILEPKVLDKNSTEITVTFESLTSAGKVHDMIVTQVDAKSGDPVNIALGDYQLTLTPNIFSE